MAINASAQWWVRTDGNNANGGGFDSAIAGAGVNYCDQASPQLSLTDLATSGAGSTTLTSATGGFTDAMIGNAVRISTGTNFQGGWYFITAYTNTNTVTVDRTPTSGGSGSVGVGRVGGAWADPNYNLASTSSTGVCCLVTDGFATGVIAGNAVNVRGSGSNDPSSVDYPKRASGALYLPSGNETAGWIWFKGYNGRPLMEVGASHWYQAVSCLLDGFSIRAGATYTSRGLLYGVYLRNCYIDQYGYQAKMAEVFGLNQCYVTNTGSTAASTNCDLIITQTYGALIQNSVIEKGRGNGLTLQGMGTVRNCIIRNNASSGIVFTDDSVRFFRAIAGNIIYGNINHGIELNVDSAMQTTINDNVVMNNSGYGIAATVDSSAINDRRAAGIINRNAFLNNALGNHSGISAGANDTILTADPFVNAAAGDFNLNNVAGGGAVLRGTSVNI
jgi:hypothetical protein